MTTELTERILEVHDITAENFAPFGTLIEPMEDGTPFGELDAKLDFSAGTPRFYAMKLVGRGTSFTRITRHRQVSQLLASVGGHEWAIAVAPPLDPENPDAAPNLDDITAFRIPGDVAIALHRAAWHAGPLLLKGAEQSFFNLELADTNVVDHQNFEIGATHGITMTLAL
jgi:ureidoglycolate lyase